MLPIRSLTCPPILAALLAIGLSACSTWSTDMFSSAPPPPSGPAAAPEIPSSIRPAEIAGRWGYAAFHKPDDRARTEAAARNGCKQPYVIGLGQSGGVIMHLADTTQPEELRLKGSQSGKNYIGPPGEVGGQQDREIVSFDGRVMITRFVDPEVSTRYGTGVYVRCGPRA